MTDNKIEINQKDLFKQYLSSRSKLEKQVSPDVIKKYEEKHEKIKKKANDKYKNNEEFKNKRKDYSKKRYEDKIKPKRLEQQQKGEVERSARSLHAGLPKTSEPNIIEEEQPQPQPEEEKRQSKKMNDLHNLFNRHLLV